MYVFFILVTVLRSTCTDGGGVEGVGQTFDLPVHLNNTSPGLFFVFPIGTHYVSQVQ